MTTVRIGTCLTLIVSIAVAATFAVAAELPRVHVSAAIAGRMHWIHFHMVSGRILGTSSLSVPKMFVQSSGRRAGPQEVLTLEINGGVCGMQYDANSSAEQIHVALVGGNQLTVRRARPGQKYLLDFDQRPDQPLKLSLEDGAEKRTWQADGFWQLFIAQPAVVREHLVPLLELLHPSWQLAATGDDVEAALLRLAAAPARPQTDRQQWARWVAELASGKFADRENAERELYRSGQIVVPYLQSLDRKQLDAEQLRRIRSIVDGLSVDYEDKVERVATWLAGDDRIWLTLLERDEVSTRRAAAGQLDRLLGEPIDFDPDAAAGIRKEQLARVRAALEKSKQAAAVKE